MDLPARRPAPVTGLPGAIAALVLVVAGGPVFPAPPAAPALAIVPPGTPVDAPDAPRWNRLILVATPRISSGDVTALPESVRERLAQFSLVLMATVRPVAAPDGAMRHELAELGAGYALPLDGRLTVVDTENPPARSGIDFLGRQILSQNGKTLVGLHGVAGLGPIRVFDAETILFRDGRHGDYLMRHLVWVEEASGQCSACVWLLAKRPDGTLACLDEEPRWVSPGTREVREIHVDEGEYLLGIPTKRAFALVDLPPGRAFPWSPGLQQAAARPRYSADEVRTLVVELDRGLETLRAAAAPTP